MAIILCILLSQQPALEAGDDRYEELHAAYLQWQGTVDYRAECVWRTAKFESEAEFAAFSWNWYLLPSEQVETARGWVAKMDNRARIYRNPNRPPRQGEPPNIAGGTGFPGLTAFQFVGYDEVTNGSFELQRPAENARGIVFDRMLVERISGPGKDPQPYVALHKSAITPVRAVNQFKSDPFDVYGPSELDPPPVMRRVVETGEGKCEVHLDVTRGTNVASHVLRFSIRDELQLIGATLSDRPNDSDIRNHTSELSIGGFVKLHDGSVPTLIRKVTRYGKDKRVVCSEYASSTPVEPELSDFRMKIEEGVPVLGLKNNAMFDESGAVDLDLLTDEDVPEVRVSPPPSQPMPWERPAAKVSEPPPPQTATLRNAVIAFNVVVVTILVVLLARKFFGKA